uniref:Uncharacterized protein n=1 Tax=Acrobeloides nanus TaxID=290746 RepID=A0A914CXJ9_9BILA
MCIFLIANLYQRISKRTGKSCACCNKFSGWFERKPKIHSPNLLGIGYTLQGQFDPYHVDFELLCGCFHTEVNKENKD